MRRQLFAIGFILMTLSSSKAFSQAEPLISFLNAYKTYEFDESKKVIKDGSFNADVDYTMSEYTSVNGLLFNTDTPEIKGYKAIVNCKIENKAHQFVEKRMMIVMYFDKIKKIWSVFSLREVADATSEYNIAKRNVEENKFYASKEFVYRNLAYWCMMAGQLQDAKKYIELGISAAKFKNSSSFTTNVDSILNSIL